MTTTVTKLNSASMATYLAPEVSGVADYLAERDVRVVFAGAGAAAAGLVGEATAEALTRLLVGEDPETVQERVGGEVVSHRQRTVLGYEWSYAPPKAFSALWAMADPASRAEFEEAAVVATAAAMGQVEESAGWTRRRRGGLIVREETEGLLAAVVPHTSSRDGDPHFHHHVVVANQARRVADGGWGTIDGRGLYGALAWSATVWGMTLRAELSERLGVEWEPVVDGLAPEIVGMPAELLELWSKRAQAIQEELEGKEKPGRWAGKEAARETRPDKDLSESRAEKFGRWQAEALEAGYESGELVAAVTGRAPEAAAGMEVSELAEQVARRLDAEWVGWDRVEWLSTAAEVAEDRLTVEELLDAADVELGEKGRWTVRLPEDPGGSAIGGRWTTPMTLARERRVIGEAVAKSRPDRVLWDPWDVDKACEAAGLDPEQAKAVWDITLEGRRFHTLAAPAGTGKTTTMGTLGKLMKEAGVLPRSLAVAQDAATGLGKTLGVPEERSQNITRFLGSEPGWAERRGWEWWIIDEASMVGSHDWDALLERAKANGTRVLAIGDPAQLGSVGPGGLFSVMVHHPEIPTAELVRVWRMEAKWEQAASLQLRERDPAAADVYAEHGRVRDHGDLDELLDGLAAAHAEGQDVLVMAHARRRVDTLNDAMQARLIGDRDPDDEMVIRWDDDEGGGERTVGVGDRIRTRRNDYDLVTTKGMTVVNGATWEVTRIDRAGLWVRSTDRGSVYLPASYLEARDEDTGRPFVELGYASTVHSAQGRTVDQAVMVVGARTEAELLYVGMTRGRTSNIAVADSGDEDGRTRFLSALANPSAETVAALELIAEGRARAARVAAAKAERERAAQERRRQERERAAALQLVEDLAGMDPEDARAVLAQQLGDSRWRREALAALSEQQQRERAARELAEREAAEAASWLDGLPDRADPEEISAAAAERWSTVDAEDLADAYLQGQQERAVSWAAVVVEGGHHPQAVVDAATQRWLVVDPEQVAASYADAYRRRLGNANRWLAEHGRAADDDLDREAEIAQRFRVLTGIAETVVERFDARQREKVGQWVEDTLQASTTWGTALWLVDREWAGTRYRADAHLAAEKWWNDEWERRRQERETPERGRGGIDL